MLHPRIKTLFIFLCPLCCKFQRWHVNWCWSENLSQQTVTEVLFVLPSPKVYDSKLRRRRRPFFSNTKVQNRMISIMIFRCFRAGSGGFVIPLISYTILYSLKSFSRSSMIRLSNAGSAFSTKKHLLVHNTTLNFPRDRSICYAEEFYLQGQNQRAMKQDWTQPRSI